MNTPVRIEDIDVSKIEIRKITKKGKADDSKGKGYHVFYNNERLEIILPELDAPGGVTIFDKYEKIKVVVNLSFDGMKETVDGQLTKRAKRLATAHAKLVALEDKIRTSIIEKASEVFKDKKKQSNDVLTSRIRPFIYQPTAREDGRVFEDSFGLQIPTKFSSLSEDDKKKKSIEELEFLKKQFQARPDSHLLVDKDGREVQVDGEEITLDNIQLAIPRRSRVKAVASFSYIWVTTSQECHSVWHFTHGLITSDKKAQVLNIRADDDEDEDDVVMEEEEVEYVEEEEEAVAVAA